MTLVIKPMLVFLNTKKIIIKQHMKFLRRNGPLAVLPSPSRQKKSSTFIFSTKNKMSLSNLSKIIKSNFYSSHGNINLRSSISHYSIKPHLSRPIQKDILLIGDTAHSIHPCCRSRMEFRY